MYKGYKTYRGYINAKLHALSFLICGSREVLDTEICRILKSRTSPDHLDDNKPVLIELSSKLLTDSEATDLYHKLIRTADAIKKNEVKANEILGINDIITDKQRKAIISLCQYKLKWNPSGTFGYLMKTIPELKGRMTGLQYKNCDLKKMYSVISKSEADTIIKRLDKIIEHNSINKSLEAANKGVMYEK